MNNKEPAQAPCDMGEAEHRENLLCRKIVESRSDLVYCCSADHRVVYLNPPLIERTGRDVTGEICYKALHGRESACPVCVSNIIQPGKSHCWELASPEDGRIYYVSNVPVIDEDGTTAKASIMYDITECRSLEENLRGDKNLSEGVINSLPGIFFLLNADLQLI